MKHDRIARINERIREELGMGLYRIGMGEPVDKTRISFVDVRTSPDLHQAVVIVSVLGAPTGGQPSEEESNALMRWLRDHRVEFQKLLAEKVGLKYTPVLTFKRTDAIERGARVLDILDALKPGAGDEPPADGESPAE